MIMAGKRQEIKFSTFSKKKGEKKNIHICQLDMQANVEEQHAVMKSQEMGNGIITGGRLESAAEHVTKRHLESAEHVTNLEKELEHVQTQLNLSLKVRPSVNYYRYVFQINIILMKNELNPEPRLLRTFFFAEVERDGKADV